MMDYTIANNYLQDIGNTANKSAFSKWLEGLSRDDFMTALKDYGDINAGFRNSPQYKSPGAFYGLPGYGNTIANAMQTWTPQGAYYRTLPLKDPGPAPGTFGSGIDSFLEAAVPLIATGALTAAGGFAGQSLLGPMLGSGAGFGVGAGAAGSAISSNFNPSEIAKGALIGGAMGGIGQGATSAIDNTVGYNPTLADAVWSESATPLTQTGANMASGAIQGAARGGINSALTGGSAGSGALSGAISGGVGGAVGSVVPSTGNSLADSFIKNNATSYLSGLVNSNSSNNSSSPINIGNGGNMALTDMKISDIGNAVAPFLSAWNTANQRGNTKDAYDQAMNLITTPSADQAAYRGQLKDLLTNAGSFYESPVYKNAYDQGLKALERSQSAKHILGSGNAATELMDYGMGQGAKYYFPMLSALTSLSGVPGDTAQRTIGAQSLLQGNAAQNEMGSSMLKDLLSGVGVKTPQQQLIDAMLGKTSESSGGTTIGGIANTLKDWFSSSGSDTSTTMPTYDFGSILPNWGNVSTSPVTSWGDLTASTPVNNAWDNTLNNIGYTDWNSLLSNPSTDYNMNWFA